MDTNRWGNDAELGGGLGYCRAVQRPLCADVGNKLGGHRFRGLAVFRTVPFQELAITAQPLPVHTTEGNKPVFSFTAEGSPAATTFSVEQSRDRGKTWQVVEGTSYRKAQLGRLDQLTLPARNRRGPRHSSARRREDGEGPGCC